MSSAGTPEARERPETPDSHESARAPKTDRTKLRREPRRGEYEWVAIREILRAGFICHLGIELDVWAGVVPVDCVIGEPQPDPAQREGIAESAAARRLRERYG